MASTQEVAPGYWLSHNGNFQVSYSSELDPIRVNEMHQWTLYVYTAGGDPVENAVIEVHGGMPEHNHGLPTTPRVLQNLGNGAYQIAGMRFHMQGEWELNIIITRGSVTDAVIIPLTI